MRSSSAHYSGGKIRSVKNRPPRKNGDGRLVLRKSSPSSISGKKKVCEERKSGQDKANQTNQFQLRLKHHRLPLAA